MISLTVFFYAASRCHNDVILLPVIRRVSGNNFVFQQDSAPAHCARARATVELLRQERTSCAQPVPVASKQPRSQSVDYKIWAVMQHRVSTTDKSIVWRNWNGISSMSGSVLNSRFLTRLLINGEEDFERVSVLKEDTSSTACELTMLILSISVTFSVTCLTVASSIKKSCQ